MRGALRRSRPGAADEEAFADKTEAGGVVLMMTFAPNKKTQG